MPHDAATHVAEADGLWSDPLIWRDGLIPAASSDVLIPDDIDVTFDLTLTDALHTVRVDGNLFFSVTQDTQMMVDTFVVSPIGMLHVGTIDQPVPLDVTATIVIADTGPIDTHWDPMLLSRGLISHGASQMYGADVTPFVALSDVPQQGDTQLTLSAEPVNWRVGDQLVVTGTSPKRNTDEQLTILAIDGQTVTVQPLQFTQQVPSADAQVYVANLFRKRR